MERPAQNVDKTKNMKFIDIDVDKILQKYSSTVHVWVVQLYVHWPFDSLTV